ncbi:hypothetical protein TUM22923_02720 [Polynucleobacter sp. TUM22923]|uniref:PilW family protein n=1 Tax=Polynucleobacter sp. TUM22923 TaxID=3022126 RepID=UPI0025737E98|nr:hypothetical protein [Polynucleobacter sp. TUM22923]BDX20951.1 hypothetical protein TUM22923_02720 [Polynucleobacter sp. TUM22923]
MSLLECLVGLAISLILVTPLMKTSGELIAKQIEYEKTQSLTAEADRALELIGRSIRMAGYQPTASFARGRHPSKSAQAFIQIQKKSGYQGSDALMVKHALSSAGDLDCIGNTLSPGRTKNGLAQQGFVVDRPASAPKGGRVNGGGGGSRSGGGSGGGSGGSLICQSLDKEGRLQNTTLMNGVHYFAVEALPAPSGKAYRVRLEMTDGHLIHRVFERTFASRNL